MLEHLKKFFNTATAEHQEEDTKNMSIETEATVQAATHVDNEAIAKLTADFQGASEALAEMTNKFAELTAQYDEAKAALTVMANEKAALVADATAKVQAGRVAELKCIVGDEKAPVLASSLKDMSDESFAVVVSAMAKTYETEASSKMFTESGVSAEVTEVADSGDTAARLVKKFAAQTKSN